jgi:trans-o-hydroxybenzylidenepyruvate hydratase-aldolase
MARNKTMLRSSDIHGAWVIMPTPAKPDASSWRSTSSVDLDETARAVEALIQSGVDGILSLGTFGEGATLSREEKREFMATVIEVNRGRVPYFGGTTALGTRETVELTRVASDLGADGTMVGLPMWCKLDAAPAVQFYRDLAEACPDMPICVYANVDAFKFEFTSPFWAEVAKIPQVVCAKYLTIAAIQTDLRLTQGRIRFLTTESDHYAAARIDPEENTAFWSSGAMCGPAPALRLRDEVRKARASGDWSVAKRTSEEVRATMATLFPKGNRAEFGKYNIALEKIRIDAAGWMKAGPCRPPYHVTPEDYAAGARKSGEAWAALHKRYTAEDKTPDKRALSQPG